MGGTYSAGGEHAELLEQLRCRPTAGAPTFGFDLDDVFFEESGVLQLEQYYEEYGVRVPLEHLYSPEAKHWDVPDIQVAIDRMSEILMRPWVFTMTPTLETVRAVHEMAELFELWAITGRNQALQAGTEQSLLSHFGGAITGVVCTGMQSSQPLPKSEVGQALGLSGFADDFPYHCIGMANAGIEAFCVNPRLPWHPKVMPPGVIAVDNVKALVPLAKDLVSAA